ncbi:MAG: hypothetical protein QOH54_6277 [Mycobacterium sp.]|nr:hypothetical protein [Mycobacterium sp.]
MNPGPANSMSSGHGVALVGCVGDAYTPRTSTASLPASRVRSTWVLANTSGAVAIAAAAAPAAKSGVMHFSLILM